MILGISVAVYCCARSGVASSWCSKNQQIPHGVGIPQCLSMALLLAQAVSRCVAEQGRVVRLPVHILDTMKRIKTVRSSLAGQEGRGSSVVTDEEVAHVLGIPASKVAFYERVRRSPYILCTRETPHYSRACWAMLHYM